MKKILSRVFTVLFAIILIVNVITAFLSVVSKQNKFGWLPYAAMSIQGESMEPEYSEGDLIIVHEEDFDSLMIGDDIAYWGTDGFVTHRIVGEENGRYITRGIANDYNDISAVSKEAYCGKVILCVPALGNVLAILSSSFAAILICALLALAVCFMRPALKKLGKRREEERDPLSIASRTVVFCGCMSILLCLPYMTDAKYVGQVNRFDMAVADSLYFTSNYLSEETGNTYSIQGWNGKAYTLALEMRNYDNSLLYNMEGVDVTYGFGYKIIGGEEYSENYTISITSSDAEASALADSGFTFPSTWGDITTVGPYTLAGSSDAPQTQRFNVVIAPEGTDALPANTKIKFEIYAATNSSEGYFLERKGTFTFTVAEGTEFIKGKEISDMGSTVSVTIRTNNLIDGASEKIVVFSWNPDYLHLNENENTAFNLINNNPSEYYDKEDGLLYVKMQAYAKVSLQFFKIDTFTAGEGSVIVEVVGCIGAEPTTSPSNNITPPEPEENSGSETATEEIK